MRRQLLAVFLISMLVYLANGRPHPEVDCVAAPYTAWSLVRHGSLDLSYYPELKKYLGIHIQECEGSWISMRPIGSSLAAVPFVLPFALVREQPFPDATMHQLGKLAASVCVALASVFFFLVCRRLAPSAAYPATALFALGTCLCSVASQALWMHGPATLWLCCAMFFLMRENAGDWRWSTLAGLALGLAVLSRPTAALFVLATGVAFLAWRRWRGVAGLALGGLVPMLLFMLLNQFFFGHPILGGYMADNWNDSPPLWLGMGGLLIAPSRGMLVYSPALILVPLGVWKLCQRHDDPARAARGMVLAWLIAAAATLWVHARWHDWRGGWSYGPRFLCETMPILCLLFALAYEGLRHGWQRRAALGLVSLSVAVHLVGVFGYTGYEAWQRRHDLNDQGRCLFQLHDTQIEAHARAVLKKIKILPREEN